ncbi:hypothetical protein QBC37DRAFT_427839, partial [Rhypophila decipiens]
MPPEETHVQHDDLFTGPSREHIVGAKAATLILRGVISTGQPPDATHSRPGSSSSGRHRGVTPVSGSGSGGTTPTATTPTHLSERMAALFAQIPTPSPTPSPENADESDSKENCPPSGNEKAKDKRIGPNGPRPMMRRVVSATGVGLGVRGRGLAGKFAAARGRTVSSSATLSCVGVGAAARRRSSRLMNMYNENTDWGLDDNVDNDNDDLGKGGPVPPSKKAKKM